MSTLFKEGQAPEMKSIFPSLESGWSSDLLQSRECSRHKTMSLPKLGHNRPVTFMLLESNHHTQMTHRKEWSTSWHPQLSFQPTTSTSQFSSVQSRSPVRLSDWTTIQSQVYYCLQTKKDGIKSQEFSLKKWWAPKPWWDRVPSS